MWFFNMSPSKCASRHSRVHFFHTSTSKSAPNMWFFNISPSKCASRHSSVHFFDISTSKRVRACCAFSILTSRCASRHTHVHFWSDTEVSLAFWLPTRVAPQPRALFPHLNLHVVFLAFWLRNVLRATATCTFGPTLGCLWHFGSHMCCAPQRRAIFHLSSPQMAPHAPL